VVAGVAERTASRYRAAPQMSREPTHGRPWKVDFVLDPDAEAPLFQQLVQAIARDIRRGRLRPGDLLPGSRTLAQSLGVARKTVVSALDELVAQGWLSASPARGMFVAEVQPALPIADVGRAPPRPAPPPALRASSPIVFDDGTPDPRLAPIDALARAYRRALRGLARVGPGYGDPRGDASLRDALATLLNQARGLAVDAEQVLVSRGSQMAIFLAARALAEPGGVIAVEDPGYRPAWDAMRLAGAELVPIAVDSAGMRVDLLAAAAERAPIRAVYTTPHHQYPTTVSLAAERRAELLRLAHARGFTVLEDDYDHEFHFADRPLLPLASSDELRATVYVGSLSKLLAPSIRAGYLVARAPIVRRAAELRAVVDRQGDPILERALAELIEDGELQRHARKARRAYAERRDLLAALLAEALGEHLTVVPARGGLALWVVARAGLDLDAWADAAARLGVRFTPGRAHAFAGERVAGVRLGYAALAPAELRAGVERLRDALPAR
jgi:GntR family transcriptional regulator/MocR family aminotransferase